MLEALLRSFNINIVNTFVLLIVLSIFIAGLIFTKKNTHKDFVNYVPTLLTTIGIFGTFLGIVLGLLSFDQSNIEASIPPLLEGLKTAFITSLAGIFSSLIFKTLSTFAFLQPKIEEDIVTPRDYLNAIEAQIDEIKKLKVAIIAENQPSLATQINSLKNDINANATLALKRSEMQAKTQHQLFDSMTDALSQMATKEAVDSLKETIHDFNYSLTEQFGRNFKYFNDGLAKSIEWQENYKVQFEQMQQLYSQAVDALLISENSITHVAEQTSRIPESMEQLKNIIDVSQYQLEALERHLEAFKEMRERAVEAVPQINEHISQVVNNLEHAALSINQHHQNLLVESDKVIQSHIVASRDFIEKFSQETKFGISHMQESNKNLVEDMQLVRNNIINSSELLEKKLREMMETHAQIQIEQARRVFSAMEEQINAQSGFTAEAVNAQLKLIDNTMQHEINHVITEMGKALNLISGQFVEDYSLLVESMNRIVKKEINN